jgi:hypothetical protein
MIAQAHFSAPPGWTGQIRSKVFRASAVVPKTHLDFCRVKARLRNGEMIVPGDHWPIFLYAGYEYDPDDPWKGLFRSHLLILVSQYS